MPAASTLRERKKRDTHNALSHAAQDLVQERGLEHVTVDDIAAAADVSVRTFFNYFSCKEEAVVGIEAGVLEELAADVRGRPVGEPPIDTLRAVLLSEVDAPTMARRWRLRNELVRRYPALLPRHLATTVQVEEALAQALADRSGLDMAVDSRPRLFVAAALAALRAALAWWEESDRTTSIADVLDAALDHAVYEVGP
ncbi:MAG: TetR/AcrR family transcriptional regulator [Acidimicrobiales bacterium]